METMKAAYSPPRLMHHGSLLALTGTFKCTPGTDDGLSAVGVRSIGGDAANGSEFFNLENGETCDALG